jgi:hypothetical protein
MEAKMKKETVFLVGLLGVLLLRPAAIARGDEISDLKQQLEAQSKSLAELQERIAQLEARQKLKEQSLTQKIEAVEQKAEKKEVSALPDNLKWLEKVKISGDLRYRHESIDAQSSGKDQPGTNHHRIRARLMLESIINDEWGVGFRLATGSSSDPASTNQTLDNGFTKKDIWLDLAYFDWHPKAIERLNVFGGKMPLPFYRAGNNQLIWDDDVNPEGIAAKYTIPLTEYDNLYVNGGGFWLKEDVGAAGGSGLWGAQTYLKHGFENKNYILGGVSFYAFSALDGKSTLFSDTKGYGNTVTTVGGKTFYTMDYDVFEGFGEYGFKIGELPTIVYGSYVKNTSANTSEDTGWLIGATFNKAKDPGSWELGYNYRDVEKDAVLGVITDSDFIGGGTDGKGNMFSGKYQLTKNIQAVLTYLLTKKGASEDDYRRLMADLVFKF